MTTVLGVMAVALYLLGTWLLGARLARADRDAPGLPLPVSGAVVAAVVLHAVVLYQEIVTQGGINLGFFNAASLVGLVIALLALATALSRPVDSLGLFVLPLAAATVAMALAFSPPPTASAGAAPGTQFHVTVSVLAYGLLTLAAFQAVLVWLQDRMLRAKRFGAGLRTLPPLTTQESLLFQLMTVGFVFLSLSLASGFVFVDDLLGQRLAHKTVLSVLAWAVFGVLVYGRWRYGWRGRAVVRWSLIGFAVLMLAYFGTKLILEIVLGRSWSA